LCILGCDVRLFVPFFSVYFEGENFYIKQAIVLRPEIGDNGFKKFSLYGRLMGFPSLGGTLMKKFAEKNKFFKILK
jgi:hypothetical protein